MAKFYTAAVAQLDLPRSPVAYAHHYLAMNATLPSIRPADILAWSTWRSSRKSDPSSSPTPLTPPMSTTFESRNSVFIHPNSTLRTLPSEMDNDREQLSSPTVLPPIAHLDRHIYNLPPCKWYWLFFIPEVAPLVPFAPHSFP